MANRFARLKRKRERWEQERLLAEAIANQQPQSGNSPNALPANNQLDGITSQSGNQTAATLEIQSQSADSGDAAQGGPGGHKRPRGPRTGGLTDIHDARLTNRAIRQGWAGKGGWQLNVKPSDIAKLATEQGGELTAQQSILSAMLNGTLSADPRIQQIAVRSGVTMHGQNLTDEHHAERMDYHERALEARAGVRGGVNVNVGEGGSVGTVQIYIPNNGRDDPVVASGGALTGYGPMLSLEADQQEQQDLAADIDQEPEDA